MRSLVFGTLSLLMMSAAISPVLRAQETNPSNSTDRGNTSIPTLRQQEGMPNNSTQTGNTSNSARRTTPFDLAYKAYHGDFSEQGIPGYDAFLTDYRAGEFSAKDVVRSAVKANQLDPQLLSDQEYIDAVEAQLQDLAAGSN
jgi:hypothetical protein